MIDTRTLDYEKIGKHAIKLNLSLSGSDIMDTLFDISNAKIERKDDNIIISDFWLDIMLEVDPWESARNEYFELDSFMGTVSSLMTLMVNIETEEVSVLACEGSEITEDYSSIYSVEDDEILDSDKITILLPQVAGTICSLINDAIMNNLNMEATLT